MTDGYKDRTLEELLNTNRMTSSKRKVIMSLINEDLLQHLNNEKPISLTKYRVNNQWRLNWYRDIGLKGYVKYLRDKGKKEDRR